MLNKIRIALLNENLTLMNIIKPIIIVKYLLSIYKAPGTKYMG